MAISSSANLNKVLGQKRAADKVLLSLPFGSNGIPTQKAPMPSVVSKTPQRTITRPPANPYADAFEARDKIQVNKGGENRMIDRNLLDSFKQAGFGEGSGVISPTNPAPAPSAPAAPGTTYPAPPTPAPGTPPVTDEGDFFSRFNSFRDQYMGTTPNMRDEEIRIAAEEEARKEALREIVRGQFERQRSDAQGLEKKKQQALNVGLGQSGGLNFSSTGLDESTGISKELGDEINQLDAEEREAISKLDVDASDRSRQRLDDIRKIQNESKKQALETFYKIQDAETSKKKEAREGQNQVRDDARSIIDSVFKNYIGADLEQLPEEMKSQLAEREKEAGLPPGFTTQGLKTLKQLKQEQDNEIANGKLDQGQAKLEQQLLISQMNAMINAVSRIPTGVSIDLSNFGLGTVEGSKSSGGGGGSSSSLSNEEQLVDASGKLVGFRQVTKNGDSKLVDIQGNPLSSSVDLSKIRVVNTAANKSTVSNLDQLNESIARARASQTTTPVVPPKKKPGFFSNLFN